MADTLVEPGNQEMLDDFEIDLEIAEAPEELPGHAHLNNVFIEKSANNYTMNQAVAFNAPADADRQKFQSASHIHVSPEQPHAPKIGDGHAYALDVDPDDTCDIISDQVDENAPNDVDDISDDLTQNATHEGAHQEYDPDELGDDLDVPAQKERLEVVEDLRQEEALQDEFIIDDGDEAAQTALDGEHLPLYEGDALKESQEASPDIPETDLEPEIPDELHFEAMDSFSETLEDQPKKVLQAHVDYTELPSTTAQQYPPNQGHSIANDILEDIPNPASDLDDVGLTSTNKIEDDQIASKERQLPTNGLSHTPGQTPTPASSNEEVSVYESNYDNDNNNASNEHQPETAIDESRLADNQSQSSTSRPDLSSDVCPNVTVHWNDNTYSLFAELGNNDENTYFFAELDALDEPLCDFLSSLRRILEDEIDDSSVLCMHIDMLDLEIGEEALRNPFYEEVSFRNVLEVHEALANNDPLIEVVPPLHITLTVRKSFESRFTELVQCVHFGQGLSEFFRDLDKNEDESSSDSIPDKVLEGGYIDRQPTGEAEMDLSANAVEENLGTEIQQAGDSSAHATESLKAATDIISGAFFEDATNSDDVFFDSANQDQLSDNALEMNPDRDVADEADADYSRHENESSDGPSTGTLELSATYESGAGMESVGVVPDSSHELSTYETFNPTNGTSSLNEESKAHNDTADEFSGVDDQENNAASQDNIAAATSGTRVDDLGIFFEGGLDDAIDVDFTNDDVLAEQNRLVRATTTPGENSPYYSGSHSRSQVSSATATINGDEAIDVNVDEAEDEAPEEGPAVNEDEINWDDDQNYGEVDDQRAGSAANSPNVVGKRLRQADNDDDNYENFDYGSDANGVKRRRT